MTHSSFLTKLVVTHHTYAILSTGLHIHTYVCTYVLSHYISFPVALQKHQYVYRAMNGETSSSTATGSFYDWFVQPCWKFTEMNDKPIAPFTNIVQYVKYVCICIYTLYPIFRVSYSHKSRSRGSMYIIYLLYSPAQSQDNDYKHY